MRIAFFDSGIGGITVLKEALDLLPAEKYYYYADTLNVPYGTRDKEEVRRLVIEAVDFIAGQGIKALVVACNTATSIAVGELRKKYNFPVIGMEPAVKPAVENCKDKRVLVLATPLTLKEEKFQNLVARVDHENKVDILPFPELVELAEAYSFEDNIIIPCLEKKFSLLKMEEYGTVVLGCTHFPFFKNYFQKILPGHIDIIDGNKGTINHLKNVLKEYNLANINDNRQEQVIFYSSGMGENFGILEKYLKLLE